MADKLIFEVVAEGKGLKVVQRDADKLAKSVEQTNDARKKGGKTQDNYNKKEKAIHQSNLSSAKSFSKMKETIGGGSSGLVGAYAVLAANVFAATAAFNALRSAAQVETLITALEATGDAAGRNLTVVAERLKDVTGNAISMEQAMRTAAVGTKAGFSDAQMGALAETAQAAAIALGRDVGDAVDRVTRGVAKLEPEILDELGLFVRLDDATEKYAANLGKSVDSLTQYERSQAFLNATLDAGAKTVATIGGAVDPNPYDKLAATLEELGNAFLNIFNTVLGPFVSMLSNSKLALVALIAVFSKGIIGSALPALASLGSKADEVLKKTQASIASAKSAAVDKVTEKAGGLGNINTQVKGYGEIAAKLNSGVVVREDILSAEKKLKKSIGIRIGQAKKLSGQQRTDATARIKELHNELRLIRAIKKEESAITAGSAGAMGDATAGGAFQTGSEGILAGLDEKGGLKDYQQAFKDQLGLNAEFTESQKKSGKTVEVFGKKFKKLPTLFKTAGAAFAGFGKLGAIAVKGIFTAIPFIGQILFALDMLVMGLKAGFKALANFAGANTRMGKAQSALNQISESYADTMTDLVRTSERDAQNTSQRAAATLQLVNASRELMEAQQDSREEASGFGKVWTMVSTYFNAAIFTMGVRMREWFGTMDQNLKGMKLSWLQSINSIKGWLNDLLGGWGSSLLKKFGFEDFKPFDVAGTEAEIKKVEDELAALATGLEYAVTGAAASAADSALVMSAPFQAMQTLLENTGAETDGLIGLFKETGQNSDTVLKALEDIGERGEKLVEEGSLAEVFGGEVEKRIKTFISSTAVASGEVGELAIKEGVLQIILEAATGEVVRQGQAVDTLLKTYQDSLPVVNTFTNTLKNTSSVKDVLPVFEGIRTELEALNPNDLQEMLDKMPEAFRKLLPLQKGSKDITKDMVDETLKLLETINRIELIEKSAAARRKRQGAMLKTLNKSNVAAIKQQTALEREGLNQQKTLIAARLTLAENTLTKEEQIAVTTGELDNLTAAQLEKVSKVLELKEQQAGNEAKIKDLAQESLNIEKAKIETFKLQLNNIKMRADTAQQEMKNEMMRANIAAGRGGDLTEAQSVKLKINAAAIAYQSSLAELSVQERLLEIENSKATIRIRANYGEEEAKELIAANTQILNIQKQGITAQRQAAKAQYEGAIIGAGAGSGFDSAKNNPITATLDAMDLAQEQLKARKTGYQQELDILLEQQADAVGTGLEGTFDQRVEDTKKKIDDFKNTLSEKIQSTMTAAGPMFEQLKQLGPEGAVVAAIGEGGLAIADAFETIKDAGLTSAEGLKAVGSIISSVSNMMAAASQNRIAKIDGEIAAEKKRDGKSKESKAKIAALEKKKEAEEKKAFERNKKMQMAMTIINTATAVMKAASEGNIFKAIFMAVLGAAQLAIIAGTSYQGGGSGVSKPSAPNKVSVGDRQNKVDLAGGSGGAAGELAYMRGARGTGTSASNFTPAFMGTKYRATGGAAYTVGEQGPEVFVPEVPGRIISNDDMRQAGGTPINATFNISAIDATNMEQTLTAQRGNIIGMIREAANSSGESFLESVDTLALGEDRTTY